MQLSSSTTPFRVVALLAVLALAFGAAIAVTAQEVPPSVYSVSATPTTCEADSVCSLTFQFTNRSPDSTTVMNRATIETPPGFSLGTVGTPTTSVLVPFALLDKSWNASVDGNIVVLEANGPLDALAPGETVSVVVDVTPSLTELGPGHVFKTTASGILLGEDVAFTNSGDDPSVTVVNDEAQCDPGFGCETRTVTLNNTSAQAVAPVGTILQFLTLSVGGNFVDADSECVTSTTFTAVGEAVTTALTPEGDGGRSHTVTLTLDKMVDNSPGAPGAEKIDICAASDKPFVTKSGGDAELNESSGFYEGILPNCPSVLLPMTTKCVLDRTRNAGKSVIRYYVEPGDPISIPGLGEI